MFDIHFDRTMKCSQNVCERRSRISLQQNVSAPRRVNGLRVYIEA